MEECRFLVRVQSFTYNHAPFIEDAMNGFVLQLTEFPFVCTIIDDASTDGEQEIIKRYLSVHFDLENKSVVRNEETDDYQLIFAQHRTNKNCFFAVFFLKYNHYQINKTKSQYISEWGDCKYIALCEGDDWWTDPLKLQKQYNILEQHSEYSLCHHNHKIFVNGRMEDRVDNVPHEQDILSLAKNNTVHTLTAFYRNYKDPIVPIDFPFRYPVYQHFCNMRLAEKGKIVYIDEPMAVYRKSNAGIYSQKSLRQKFLMSFGNIENMIDWYSNGTIRPDVVRVLRKMARGRALRFLKYAVLSRDFHCLSFMLKWGVKYFI